MAYRLLKTEPRTYPFEQLESESRTFWDGVTSAPALKRVRAMRQGGRALIYPLGYPRTIVGEAESPWILFRLPGSRTLPS